MTIHLTAEQKIRAAFNAVPNLSIQVWYPISVEHNGITCNFLAKQKVLPKWNSKNEASIHLVTVKLGRILLGDDPTPVLRKYALNGKNVLNDAGLPNYANEEALLHWKESGFTV